jgi:hypothetical protein
MGRVTRGFRKLLHEKLHVPSYSRHIFRAMKSEKNETRRQERRGVCKVVGGNSEEQKLLLGPRRRWENIIKLDLQERKAWTELN